MLLKINNKIADTIEGFLKLTDTVYTRNGTEFDLPSVTEEGFVFGRYYQETLSKYKSGEIQLQKKEESGKN